MGSNNIAVLVSATLSGDFQFYNYGRPM